MRIWAGAPSRRRRGRDLGLFLLSMRIIFVHQRCLVLLSLLRCACECAGPMLGRAAVAAAMRRHCWPAELRERALARGLQLFPGAGADKRRVQQGLGI